MISSWLLSIAGVVLLCVLCEFIIPDGQMNKYVKSIFSFVILLVIILPLPKIFKSEIDIENLLKFDTSLQENYLEQINLDKLNLLSEQVSKKIREEGFENVVVSINANIFATTLEVFGMTVDIKNMKTDVDKSTAKSQILKIIKSIDDFSSVEVNFSE